MALLREEIVAKLQANLDPARFAHSLRVEKIALALAKKWKADQKQAGLAALLHDCARRFDRSGLLRQAKALGIKIDPVQQFEPKLLHAELSSLIAQAEFGVKSPAVLAAISRHTTGAPNMSRLDKIIYLADHIEEDRDFRGVFELRRLAFRDLDRAVIASAQNMIQYLLERGLPVDPATILTRNYLLLKRTK